jgi:hypothetical protein
MANRPHQTSNTKKPAPSVAPAATSAAPAPKPAAAAAPSPVAAPSMAKPMPAPVAAVLAAKAAPVPAASAGAVTRVSFKADWSHAPAGDLVAGSKLQLDYDLHRFEQLMHRSQERGAGWGVKAHVMAQPTGAVQEKELVRFGKDSAPQVEAHAFEIPPGTTAVQVWFKVWTADGKRHEAYDSNFGKNYTFAVRAK